MPNSFAENNSPDETARRHESDEYAPTRSSLVQKLQSWDDHSSWQRFFDTYWKLIYTVATRAGLSDSEAQEVVQETIIGVAKEVKDFKYDRSKGKFRGWLTMWASWRIQDQFRKRSRSHNAFQPLPSTDDIRTDLIERIPDPKDNLERLWLEEWDQKLQEVVLQRVKNIISPTQYQIFDCYVLKGWPVSRVVDELGVSKAKVYLARTRISHLIKAEMARVENGIL